MTTLLLFGFQRSPPKRRQARTFTRWALDNGDVPQRRVLLEKDRTGAPTNLASSQFASWPPPKHQRQNHDVKRCFV